MNRPDPVYDLGYEENDELLFDKIFRERAKQIDGPRVDPKLFSASIYEITPYFAVVEILREDGEYTYVVTENAVFRLLGLKKGDLFDCRVYSTNGYRVFEEFEVVTKDLTPAERMVEYTFTPKEPE